MTRTTMSKVTNRYGIEVDFDLAVSLMYDDLREEIHDDLAPCTDQEFFDAYAAKHAEKYGEDDWQPARENPVM